MLYLHSFVHTRHKKKKKNLSYRHPLLFFPARAQTPKAKVARIMQYVKRQVDEVHVEEGRWFTGIGILCFVFGGLLLILRLVIGAIMPQPPSRKDLSRRKLFK